MKNKLILFLFFMSALITASAQQHWVMNSKYLPGRDTVYVFKPKNRDVRRVYPLIYLLHGYGQTSRQWNHVISLQELANHYRAIVICPDGFQTWYLNSPELPNSRFADFFFNELVPKVHHAYRIDDHNIFISGLSMGGYGALYLFLQKPGYFNTAAATSGAFEFEEAAWKKASYQFFKNDRISHDLAAIIGRDSSQWNKYNLSALLKKSGISKQFLFDCGTEDVLLPMTLRLKQVCDSLKIPVTCTLQPGDHSEAYWRASIIQHLAYFQAHMDEN